MTGSCEVGDCVGFGGEIKKKFRSLVRKSGGGGATNRAAGGAGGSGHVV